jgi:hypothetical protein
VPREQESSSFKPSRKLQYSICGQLEELSYMGNESEDMEKYLHRPNYSHSDESEFND